MGVGVRVSDEAPNFSILPTLIDQMRAMRKEILGAPLCPLPPVVMVIVVLVDNADADKEKGCEDDEKRKLCVPLRKLAHYLMQIRVVGSQIVLHFYIFGFAQHPIIVSIIAVGYLQELVFPI